MTRRGDCWGCRSGYFRFMLDRQRELKWHCKWFAHASSVHWSGIGVMTIQFMRIIDPTNCQHFQRPLPVSASVTPVHSKEGAPEGKLEIVPICKRNQKHTFVKCCALCSPWNYWCIWIVISGVILYGQKRFLYQTSTTRLLFPNPIGSHESVGKLGTMHGYCCQRVFPTQKKIAGVGKSVDLHCNSCSDFAKYIDDQVIFSLVCLSEWRLWI